MAACDACATFFIDTTYLNKLKLSRDMCDHQVYDKIVSQLQQIVINGSRIELHLHPHWIDAIKKGESWQFPHYHHYKMNSLTKDVIESLFNDGCMLLNQIAREVDPKYNVEVFRAGGWCVEPIDLIKKSFDSNSIKIDSSVCPGLYLNGDIHQVDYRNVPARALYTFSDNIRNCEANGKLVEIPVNGYFLSAYERLIWVLQSRLHKNKSMIWGDGSGIMSVKNQSKIRKHIQLVCGEKYFAQFSIDGYVDKYILYRKVSNSNLPFITMVAHPKTLTESSLESIRFFKQKGLDFYTIKKITDGYIQ